MARIECPVEAYQGSLTNPAWTKCRSNVNAVVSPRSAMTTKEMQSVSE
jgi:hypothetical protein